VSGFPGAARTLRGGFVFLDPTTSRPVRTVPFQFNPDTLTRKLQPQAIGPEPGDRLEALRLKGPPHETYTFDAEFDATDQLDQPDAHPVEADNGLLPALSSLESALFPTVRQLLDEDALASLGVIEVAPAEAPLTVLVLGRARVLPVRITDLSITEEAFDTSLRPLRVKAGIGVRVLTVDDVGFRHRAGQLYLEYHRAREQFAGLVVASPSDLGLKSL
jgi:hypothetical protein